MWLKIQEPGLPQVVFVCIGATLGTGFYGPHASGFLQKSAGGYAGSLQMDMEALVFPEASPEFRKS